MFWLGDHLDFFDHIQRKQNTLSENKVEMMSDGTFRYLPARLRHGAWELRLGQGSKELDASLLLLPAIGFLRPHDVRIRGTVAAIGRGLLRNGLVLRYDTGLSDDSLPAGEGVFLACSFWLADAYLMLGR